MSEIRWFGSQVLLLWLCFGICRDVTCGEFITHVVESERLAGSLIGEPPSRQVSVLLPAGYQENQLDYPVVYWFPGGGQRPTSNIKTTLIDEEFNSGRSSPAIIVFVDSETEYGTSLFLSSAAFGDGEGFVTQELIPFIDQTYRTLPYSDKRGAMGFSLGGMTSLMMPLVAPGMFGAVGANDPSVFISSSVRSEDELPEGLPPSDGEGLTIEEFFEAYPDSLEGFNQSGVLISTFGQLAAKLSPNSEHPLHGELPFLREGGWNPEIRQQWRKFDLLNPDSVDLHESALQELATVSVILPEAEKRVATPWNREMVRVLKDAGVPAQGIVFEGDHNDLQHERFITLLSNVTYALQDESYATLGNDPYKQVFDVLGSDDSRTAPLPGGWSVSDGEAYIFRDRTNTAFDGGNVQPVGHGPYILNVGEGDAADRALAVYVPEGSDGARIQFLADTESTNGNAFRLKFDIEAWDKVFDSVDSGPGEAIFAVTAEFDFGNGFEQLVEVGSATTGTKLRSPNDTSHSVDFGTFLTLSANFGQDSSKGASGGDLDGDGIVSFGDFLVLSAKYGQNLQSDDYLNGNRDENRIAFDTGILVAPVGDARAMRLRWSTDTLIGSTQEWVFGLDDIELSFLTQGDFDDDEVLTAQDIDLLSAVIKAGGTSPGLDLNSDGIVDDLDRNRWLELAGSDTGDANLDGTVDLADFLAISIGFNSADGWAAGDFDGDGKVAFGDFLLLSTNLGQKHIYSASTQAVPEPASNLLLACFAIAAIMRRRCKN